MQPTISIDLSREKIGPYNDGKVIISEMAADTKAVVGASRRSGEYWAEIQGNRIECGSLKELLGESLKAMELARQERLADESRFRVNCGWRRT